jgi:hypothetical protein
MALDVDQFKQTYERENQATDGTMRAEGEYLIMIARLPQ